MEYDLVPLFFIIKNVDFLGGFLTQNISSLLKQDCKSIILDGELMGYHKTKKKFSSKGDNIDVKNFKDTSAHQPCFVAFDIVLYNDQLLVDKPYYERLAIMENAFAEKEGVLMKSQTRTISTRLINFCFLI